MVDVVPTSPGYGNPFQFQSYQRNDLVFEESGPDAGGGAPRLLMQDYPKSGVKQSLETLMSSEPQERVLDRNRPTELSSAALESRDTALPSGPPSENGTISQRGSTPLAKDEGGVYSVLSALRGAVIDESDGEVEDTVAKSRQRIKERKQREREEALRHQEEQQRRREAIEAQHEDRLRRVEEDRRKQTLAKRREEELRRLQDQEAARDREARHKLQEERAASEHRKVQARLKAQRLREQREKAEKEEREAEEKRKLHEEMERKAAHAQVLAKKRLVHQRKATEHQKAEQESIEIMEKQYTNDVNQDKKAEDLQRRAQARLHHKMQEQKRIEKERLQKLEEERQKREAEQEHEEAELEVRRELAAKRAAERQRRARSEEIKARAQKEESERLNRERRNQYRNPRLIEELKAREHSPMPVTEERTRLEKAKRRAEEEKLRRYGEGKSREEAENLAQEGEGSSAVRGRPPRAPQGARPPRAVAASPNARRSLSEQPKREGGHHNASERSQSVEPGDTPLSRKSSRHSLQADNEFEADDNETNLAPLTSEQRCDDDLGEDMTNDTPDQQLAIQSDPICSDDLDDRLAPIRSDLDDRSVPMRNDNLDDRSAPIRSELDDRSVPMRSDDLDDRVTPIRSELDDRSAPTQSDDLDNRLAPIRSTDLDHGSKQKRQITEEDRRSFRRIIRAEDMMDDDEDDDDDDEDNEGVDDEEEQLDHEETAQTALANEHVGLEVQGVQNIERQNEEQNKSSIETEKECMDDNDDEEIFAAGNSGDDLDCDDLDDDEMEPEQGSMEGAIAISGVAAVVDGALAIQGCSFSGLQENEMNFCNEEEYAEEEHIKVEHVEASGELQIPSTDSNDPMQNDIVEDSVMKTEEELQAANDAEFRGQVRKLLVNAVRDGSLEKSLQASEDLPSPQSHVHMKSEIKSKLQEAHGNKSLPAMVEAAFYESEGRSVEATNDGTDDMLEPEKEHSLRNDACDTDETMEHPMKSDDDLQAPTEKADQFEMKSESENIQPTNAETVEVDLNDFVQPTLESHALENQESEEAPTSNELARPPLEPNELENGDQDETEQLINQESEEVPTSSELAQPPLESHELENDDQAETEHLINQESEEVPTSNELAQPPLESQAETEQLINQESDEIPTSNELAQPPLESQAETEQPINQESDEIPGSNESDQPPLEPHDLEDAEQGEIGQLNQERNDVLDSNESMQPLLESREPENSDQVETGQFINQESEEAPNSNESEPPPLESQELENTDQAETGQLIHPELQLGSHELEESEEAETGQLIDQENDDVPDLNDSLQPPLEYHEFENSEQTDSVQPITKESDEMPELNDSLQLQPESHELGLEQLATNGESVEVPDLNDSLQPQPQTHELSNIEGNNVGELDPVVLAEDSQVESQSSPEELGNPRIGVTSPKSPDKKDNVGDDSPNRSALLIPAHDGEMDEQTVSPSLKRFGVYDGTPRWSIVEESLSEQSGEHLELEPAHPPECLKALTSYNELGKAKKAIRALGKPMENAMHLRADRAQNGVDGEDRIELERRLVKQEEACDKSLIDLQAIISGIELEELSEESREWFSQVVERSAVPFEEEEPFREYVMVLKSCSQAFTADQKRLLSLIDELTQPPESSPQDSVDVDERIDIAVTPKLAPKMAAEDSVEFSHPIEATRASVTDARSDVDSREHTPSARPPYRKNQPPPRIETGEPDVELEKPTSEYPLSAREPQAVDVQTVYPLSARDTGLGASANGTPVSTERKEAPRQTTPMPTAEVSHPLSRQSTPHQDAPRQTTPLPTTDLPPTPSQQSTPHQEKRLSTPVPPPPSSRPTSRPSSKPPPVSRPTSRQQSESIPIPLGADPLGALAAQRQQAPPQRPIPEPPSSADAIHKKRRSHSSQPPRSSQSADTSTRRAGSLDQRRDSRKSTGSKGIPLAPLASSSRTSSTPPPPPAPGWTAAGDEMLGSSMTETMRRRADKVAANQQATAKDREDSLLKMLDKRQEQQRQKVVF